MSRFDLEQYILPFTAQQFEADFTAWKALPGTKDLTAGELADKQRLFVPTPNVEGYARWQRRRFDGLARREQHLEAIGLLNTNVYKIDGQFSGDDATSAMGITLRRRAYAKELLATYGAVAQQFDQEDPIRRNTFVSAAYDNLRADLRLGLKTQYAYRMAACFEGALMPGRMAQVMRSYHGPDLKIISVDPDTLAQIMQQVTVVEEQPNRIPMGGTAKVVEFNPPLAFQKVSS